MKREAATGPRLEAQLQQCKLFHRLGSDSIYANCPCKAPMDCRHNVQPVTFKNQEKQDAEQR